MELLFYHTHTQESNYNVSEMLSAEDNPMENHYADYAGLVENLPDSINPIIVRTEHFKKRAADDSKSFHNTFRDEIEERGGQVETHKTHVTGTLGENSFSVIDGVEGSIEEPDSHVLLCGLPRETEIEALNLDLDEFYDLAEDSAWAGLPHWNVMSPDNDTKEELLHNSQKRDDLDIAPSYATGYGFTNNFINTETGGESVEDYAERYGVQMIPELDWHTTLPYRLNGVGVVEDVLDELEDGDIPTERILSSDMISYDTSVEQLYNSARDTWNFLDTMVMPPNAKGAADNIAEQLYRTFLDKDGEEYRAISRENLAEATEVTEDLLADNAQRL